ncbi:MAG: glycerophosphodiester phosphodiesterase [Actinomycetota bacterium]|nr:glycerophosphodiester phosphodiesterase [Actinomycetota bacterium]
MPTRVPSIMHPPIGFAHRGARAHAPENTIEAFSLALRLGATGLESDVWLTADGEAVLDHDGVLGSLRKRRIASVTRAELPEHIPTLAELFERCGSDFELSLDVKDPSAGSRVAEVVRSVGPEQAERVWLCHDDLELMTSWRDEAPGLRLVDSTYLRHAKQGPERLAATLQAGRIDAVNLHHSEWSGGLVTLFHRFGILAFGWDAQHDRVLDELLDSGIDAVYSDHVDRLVEALGRLVETS